MALTGAAALAALYAAGLLYEIALAPPGCCALTWPNPDPAQAERVLTAADPKGQDGAAQGRAAVAELAASPGHANGWMRLAYADRLKNGRLTDVGAKALEMSYEVQPYAYWDAPWRIIFTLNNWDRLTPQTRLSAFTEFGIVKSVPQIHEVRRRVARYVTNPSGRIAAALMGLLDPTASVGR